MKPRRCLALAMVLALVFVVVLARPAYAYLDPGTGSFIFQMLIAGLVGSLFALKMYWQRIKGFFAHRRSKGDGGAEHKGGGGAEHDG